MLYIHYCPVCEKVYMFNGHKKMCPACEKKVYEIPLSFASYTQLDQTARLSYIQDFHASLPKS